MPLRSLFTNLKINGKNQKKWVSSRASVPPWLTPALATLHGERMKLPQRFCIHLSAEKPPSLSLSQGSDPNPTNACRVPFTPMSQLVYNLSCEAAQSSTTLQGALNCTSRSGCHDSAFSFLFLFWLVALPYAIVAWGSLWSAANKGFPALKKGEKASCSLSCSSEKTVTMIQLDTGKYNLC